MIVHAGKLLALKEDSPALIMDPLTLDTQGYTNWNGKCTSQTFTAHPKIDPLTGNLVAFSYASKGLLTKDCTYMEISPTGELLMSLGTAGKAGNGPGQFNQPNDVIVAPDGSIFVSDGHSGQGMTTNQEMADGRAQGLTARVMNEERDDFLKIERGPINELG